MRQVIGAKQHTIRVQMAVISHMVNERKISRKDFLAWVDRVDIQINEIEAWIDQIDVWLDRMD